MAETKKEDGVLAVERATVEAKALREKARVEHQATLKDPAAEKKDRESRWSPEHREFDHLIERLVARVAGMQLRPEETRKFNVDLEALKKVSGHPQD